jgi:hypothetical protein
VCQHRHTTCFDNGLYHLLRCQLHAGEVGRSIAPYEALKGLLKRLDVTATEQCLCYVGTTNAAAIGRRLHLIPGQWHPQIRQASDHVASSLTPSVAIRLQPPAQRLTFWVHEVAQEVKVAPRSFCVYLYAGDNLKLRTRRCLPSLCYAS